MQNTNKRAATCACVVLLSLLGFVLAGCGEAEDLPRKTIYISAPTGSDLAQRREDFIDAAKLALDQTGYDTPDVAIELKVLNGEDPASEVQRAIADRDALSIVEGFQDERTKRAIRFDPPILQVLASPLVGAEDQVDDGGTSIHVMPSAESSGRALAQAMASEIDDREVRLTSSPSAFSRAATRGFRSEMSRIGVRVVGYRASRGGGVPPGVFALSGSDAGIVYIADDPSLADPSIRGVLVTPAMAPANYPPNGEKFFDLFEDAYGRSPDRFAIFGYEAMGLALNAITEAGESGKPVTRESTLAAAFAIRNRFGPVGHYDVLPSGETTLYTLAARRWTPVSWISNGPSPPERSRVIEVGR
ncbi:MAG: hypothetical protein WAP35_03660 [Solirubrobacterales bacterium]